MPKQISKVFLGSLFVSLILSGMASATQNDVASKDMPLEDVSHAIQPGRILDQTPIPEEALIAGAANGFLLRYGSTDGLDGSTKIQATGALYLPHGTPPATGWPLIAWSHGTVGIGDACAPSIAGRSQRDLIYLSRWLSQGYAIIASDYQGLGTRDVHPYMATRPMAYSTLDGIRAVQSADFAVSDGVVIAGQSQGAAAAIATAGFQAGYAPDVELLAIAATGVPYFPPAIQAALLQSDSNTPGTNVALGLYMLTLSELLQEDFSLTQEVSEELRPVISQIYEMCLFDFIDATVEAGVTSRDFMTPAAQATMPETFAAMEYPRLRLPVPAFVGIGELDAITPPSMQKMFVDDACAAGSQIELRVYPYADHNGSLIQSIPDAERFFAHIFEGEVPNISCN